MWYVPSLIPFVSHTRYAAPLLMQWQIHEGEPPTKEELAEANKARRHERNTTRKPGERLEKGDPGFEHSVGGGGEYTLVDVSKGDVLIEDAKQLNAATLAVCKAAFTISETPLVTKAAKRKKVGKKNKKKKGAVADSNTPRGQRSSSSSSVGSLDPLARPEEEGEEKEEQRGNQHNFYATYEDEAAAQRKAEAAAVATEEEERAKIAKRMNEAILASARQAPSTWQCVKAYVWTSLGGALFYGYVDTTFRTYDPAEILLLRKDFARCVRKLCVVEREREMETVVL